MVMDQVVFPFALRLTDVEEMFELKFFDCQCFSSRPCFVALTVFWKDRNGAAESQSLSLSTGEVQWCAQPLVKM